MAVARAAAMDKGVELYEHFNSLAKEGTPMSLPAPMLNVLNGGEHADNTVDMQEYMLFPLGAPTFGEALR
jgi:enolase